MKIKVGVFRSEEDMKLNTSLYQTFELSINVPYPFPAVGDEFRKVIKDKARDEVLKKLYGEDASQDVVPVNIECATKNWDCKEGMFTLQLEFSGRHAVMNYNNGTITDYSKPDEIFYLKGTIEQ